MQPNSSADCTQFWPQVTWCTNTACVVAVQVKRFLLMANICCCKLYFWDNFFFLFSSLHLFSDGNNITQVETVDSFVHFLTSHMELAYCRSTRLQGLFLVLALETWVLGLGFGFDSQQSFENTVKVQTKYMYSLHRQNLTNVGLRMRTKWTAEGESSTTVHCLQIQTLYFHNTSE